MYPWVSHQTKPSRSQAIDALKEMERSWDIAGSAPFDMQFGSPALPPDRSMHELHLKQLDKYKRYMGRHPQCLPLDVLNKRCLLPQLILEHCKLLGSEHKKGRSRCRFSCCKNVRCWDRHIVLFMIFYDLLCRLGDLGCVEFACHRYQGRLESQHQALERGGSRKILVQDEEGATVVNPIVEQPKAAADCVFFQWFFNGMGPVNKVMLSSSFPYLLHHHRAASWFFPLHPLCHRFLLGWLQGQPSALPRFGNRVAGLGRKQTRVSCPRDLRLSDL